ncbi:MAG: hypothetical protein IKH41_09330 [Clostridia bacterium]|nr:hypothetical protein [Clostridia bacterium]
MKKDRAAAVIDTAANRKKAECGRTTYLTDTAENREKAECGRTKEVSRSSLPLRL